MSERIRERYEKTSHCNTISSGHRMSLYYLNDWYDVYHLFFRYDALCVSL